VVNRLEDPSKATWQELVDAGLGTSYASCLVAWLQNPNPEELETLVRTEMARREHAQHAWVAWAGASVLAAIGLFAIVVVSQTHVPVYGSIGESLDVGDTAILSYVVKQSPQSMLILAVVIAIALGGIAVWMVRRAFRASRLSRQIDNTLLANAANSVPSLDLAAVPVKHGVSYTALQQWSSEASSVGALAPDAATAVGATGGAQAGRFAAARRRRFSLMGHQWMLSAYVAKGFRRTPLVVSVVVGAAFAIFVGGMIFGAFADLVVSISQQ
jgi:hypothetical protein